MPLLLSLLLSLATDDQSASEKIDPVERDARCLVALRHDGGAAGRDAIQYFELSLAKSDGAKATERAAEQVIAENRNRREIASDCILLYQVLKLQEDRASFDRPGEKASFAGRPAGTEPGPPWKIVKYPNGGELRYRPPLRTEQYYPQKAKDAGLEGETRLSLELTRDGLISRCDVLRSSGWVELDEAACTMYRAEAQFQLHGMDGPLLVNAPVIWRLETDEPNSEKR